VTGREKISPTIPAAPPASSLEELSLAPFVTAGDYHPSRKNHLPAPTDWICEHHGARQCMSCWYVEEATRLYRANRMIEDVPLPIPPVSSVESILRANTGISPPIKEQLARELGMTLPEPVREEIKVEPEKEIVVVPQRLFYRRKFPPNYPYPEYMGWYKRNSGTLRDVMLPEDVAFLLTQGAFHYEDYEKFKDNPPREVFQSAAISFDNPSWKRSGNDLVGERNPLDVHSQTLFRPQESGVSAVGTGEAGILTREKAKTILVEALPELMRVRDLNKEHRIGLETERENLKTELWNLSPKNKKSGNSLTGTARASAQTKCRRRIKAIDKELRALDRDWKKIRLEGTGRPAFSLQVPPCPEGSQPLIYLPGHRRERLMTWAKFQAYAEEAFGAECKDHPEHWDRCAAPLENAILEHAEVVGLLDGWVKDSSAPVESRQWLESDFDAIDADEDASAETQENAQRGYKRDENGKLADETIQKSSGKNHGDWRWGMGHPVDGAGDSVMDKKDDAKWNAKWKASQAGKK
jgi:hypothetical protein